jgi:hypothetical protein
MDILEGVSNGFIRGNWNLLMRRKYNTGGKVGVVMSEYKKGNLKSSSGKKVTNPKQAVAIAMSEARKQRRT